MTKRKLDDLNLLDDFLFGSMVNHPEVGEIFVKEIFVKEIFVKEILRIIFGKPFGKVRIVPQKVYYGIDTDKHGARLDLYLEESSSDQGEDVAAVYDVEPDKNDDNEAVSALPRRVRFYHAKIDGNSLGAGESYRNLKNVFVIIITPYDPFGSNRMIYTIRSMCEEMPSLSYDDGAKTIFLYTRGVEGNPPEELKRLLHYMENTKEENATDESLKAINQMVNLVKHDREVSISYMKTVEWEEMLIKQGRKEEQVNTERERLRADAEANRADRAEAEVLRLKKRLAEMESQG